MGHFLLTELLLPLLRSTKRARVVNVASSVHLQVSGEALRPPPETTGATDEAAAGSSSESTGLSGSPEAARSDVFTTRHWMDSYGNSKLAQILHSYELQALLDRDDSTDLKVRGGRACPLSCVLCACIFSVTH
jgi:NAD(P)-dependent dehydrogenase (short-subunit alcohol dehydrogenase family)